MSYAETQKGPHCCGPFLLSKGERVVVRRGIYNGVFCMTLTLTFEVVEREVKVPTMAARSFLTSPSAAFPPYQGTEAMQTG